jgi:hypothetical protein
MVNENINMGWYTRAFGPRVQEWDFKGHKCKIELDYEPDNVKAFHSVITPDGRELFADISPYDTKRDTVNLWIEAGFPRSQSGNWDYKSLVNYVMNKRGNS